jgi:ATP-dependent protease ClpP protease subunit
MAKKTWFSAAAGANGTADIAIYDDIGSWGVTSGDFRDALAAVGPVDTIKLRLNSRGGDVFDGIAIHNMLARHPAKVNVTVDGVAASIASIIAMAGDEVTMPENATMFIHNPFALAMGDATVMAEMSDALDKLGRGMAATYARKTGQEPEAMLAVMNANTWMTAQEAKDKGFADVVAAPAKIVARFDLRHLAPPAAIVAQLQAAYDPDGDGDDDVLECLGFIGKAIDNLADAVGCLTGAGDPDDDSEPAPPAMASLRKALRAALSALPQAAADAPAVYLTGDLASFPANSGEAEQNGGGKETRAEEMIQISAACKLAGLSDLATEFMQSGKSLVQVQSELLKLRANRGDGSDGEIGSRHNPISRDLTETWAKTLDKINARN